MSDGVVGGNGAPRAIHLAAGEGTRLRPITEDRPKPLVELAGTSLLERNVATLESAGVTDQYVVTGYRADQIRELGLETVHNPDYAETDMVYSLFCAADVFPQDRDLLISYGDIVYERTVVEALLDYDAPVCVIADREWRRLWKARFADPLSDAETFRTAGDDRVSEIGGDPDGYDDIEAQYVGLITVRHDYLDRFRDHYYDLSSATDDGDLRSDVEMTHFLQHLVDEGWDVRAVPVDGGWIEVDTIEDIELYRDLVARNALSRFVSLDN